MMQYKINQSFPVSTYKLFGDDLLWGNNDTKILSV